MGDKLLNIGHIKSGEATGGMTYQVSNLIDPTLNVAINQGAFFNYVDNKR